MGEDRPASLEPENDDDDAVFAELIDDDDAVAIDVIAAAPPTNSEPAAAPAPVAAVVETSFALDAAGQHVLFDAAAKSTAPAENPATTTTETNPRAVGNTHGDLPLFDSTTTGQPHDPQAPRSETPAEAGAMSDAYAGVASAPLVDEPAATSVSPTASVAGAASRHGDSGGKGGDGNADDRIVEDDDAPSRLMAALGAIHPVDAMLTRLQREPAPPAVFKAMRRAPGDATRAESTALNDAALEFRKRWLGIRDPAATKSA